MEGTIPTPPASSTVTSTSSASLQVPPFQLLEISIISAQDLPRIAKSMKTYAIAWLHPNRRIATHGDSKGGVNPNWNEKLLFRIDDKFLFSETSSLTIEIYTVSWFRDILVGTVRVLITDLITPLHKQQRTGERFIKLQIRRSSGAPQGILNMGYSLGSTTKQNIPLYSELSADKSQEKECVAEDANEVEEPRIRMHEKMQLWRSRSVNELSDDDLQESACNGSAVNGSVVNGSELCSDVGPSASIVAAELAQKAQPQPQRSPVALPAVPPRPRASDEAEEMGSSILEELTVEEAIAKGWRMDFPAKSGTGKEIVSRNTRRHSDGGGLFSCFGNAYGIEFHIVCGNNHGRSRKKNRKRSR